MLTFVFFLNRYIALISTLNDAVAISRHSNKHSRGDPTSRRFVSHTHLHYLRLRIQWMSEGAISMTGSVKSADRQR